MIATINVLIFEFQEVVPSLCKVRSTALCRGGGRNGGYAANFF